MGKYVQENPQTSYNWRNSEWKSDQAKDFNKLMSEVGGQLEKLFLVIAAILASDAKDFC